VSFFHGTGQGLPELVAMHHKVLRVFTRGISTFKLVDVSPEVSRALAERQPVLALESTIITHGMPYPRNLEMAESVEQIVREQTNTRRQKPQPAKFTRPFKNDAKLACFKGAVPATIGIVGGRVKVGLERDSMVELAILKTPAVKTSRRDFPYVLSKGLNGGTTVSGTIIVANLVGIKVFATGGIGGVHRGGEVSMDVSADLTELGRNPVTVVSSGVKSILDIGRTLEYLVTTPLIHDRWLCFSKDGTHD
ncbi:unnamed protein product, partial [Timema podura]|nr:unnamed protein product [Timema podura]